MINIMTFFVIPSIAVGYMLYSISGILWQRGSAVTPTLIKKRKVSTPYMLGKTRHVKTELVSDRQISNLSHQNFYLRMTFQKNKLCVVQQSTSIYFNWRIFHIFTKIVYILRASRLWEGLPSCTVGKWQYNISPPNEAHISVAQQCNVCNRKKLKTKLPPWGVEISASSLDQLVCPGDLTQQSKLVRQASP